MQGRSVFARNQLAGYDIGTQIAVDPILAWSKAMWDGFVTDEVLFAAWRHAIYTVYYDPKPFSKVVGPAGAFIASILRMGWKSLEPSVLIDGNGNIMDLKLVSPISISIHAKAALTRVDGAASHLAARLGGIPDLEALKTCVNSKRNSPPVAESLRALGEGGWWTQERHFSSGTYGFADPYCRACEPAEQIGTLRHRSVDCSASQPLRDQFADQEIFDIAAQSIGSPLFEHGVPIVHEDTYETKVPTEVIRWIGGKEPAEFTFTGNGFSDGSVLHPQIIAARRAGWAAVLVDDKGHLIAGLYGTCPDRYPTSLRAELYGVMHMLRLAVAPLTIWVDNQNVVSGFVNGRQWCCSAARPAADLWRRVWDIYEDIGGGITVVKTKGHATDADVQAGPCY